MAEQIRAFIAIELGEAQRRALGQVQAQLKEDRAGRYVRWVAPEGIHLTLKFLGGVDAVQIPAVEHAVAEGCTGIEPFKMSFAGLGAFPNVHRPNVVWVGLTGDVERAERLAEQIDQTCHALGFARETRPFALHLTLGRCKRDIRPSDQQSVGEMVTNAKVGELGEFRVERVSLMKSDLRPTGSIYTELHAKKLGKDE